MLTLIILCEYSCQAEPTNAGDFACSILLADGTKTCSSPKNIAEWSYVKAPTFDVVNRIDMTASGRDGISYLKLVVALIHNISLQQEVISREFNRYPDEIIYDGYGNQYAIFSGIDDVEIRYQVAVYNPNRIIVTQGKDLRPLHEPYNGDHYFYAYEYGWVGNYGASSSVKDSWSIKKQIEEPWLKKGMHLAEKGEYEEAIKAFDKANDLEPKNATIWYNKGLALNLMGKYLEASEAFDKVVELDPNCIEAWHKKGNILENLSNYNESIEAYERAILIDMNCSVVWKDKGRALVSLGRLDEAVAAFSKSLELDPSDSDTWFYRGNALSSLERYEEAIVNYDKAIELKPSHAKARFNKSNALRLMNYNKN